MRYQIDFQGDKIILSFPTRWKISLLGM